MKVLRKTNVAFNQKLEINKKLSQSQKQLQKERLAELKLQKDRERAFDKLDKQEQQAIKTAQKLRKETVDTSNAFKVLTKRTNTAQARFKRLAAQYGETDKRTLKALKTFNRLDTRLRSINNTARDGRRDVGRYGQAFRGLGDNLKTLFIAGGVVGVIRGIGRAIDENYSKNISL